MLWVPLLLLAQCKQPSIEKSLGQVDFNLFGTVAYMNTSGQLKSLEEPESTFDIQTDSLLQDGIFVAHWDERGRIYHSDGRLLGKVVDNTIYMADNKKIASIEARATLTAAQIRAMAAYTLYYEDGFLTKPQQ